MLGHEQRLRHPSDFQRPGQHLRRTDPHQWCCSGTLGQAYRYQFSSLADSTTANCRIVFATAAVTHADGSVFQYNGPSALTLNNRVIEIASTEPRQPSVTRFGQRFRQRHPDHQYRPACHLHHCQTVRLGGTNTGNNTFGGKISNGNSSAVSLTKVDAGKWILSGTNSYTGTTTISGGTLLINGNSSAVNGAVSVASATIGGNGSLGGAVTVSGTGGINLNDGAVGTLTLGSTLGITGALGANNLVFDLGNGTGISDQISVADTTTVTTTGAAVITLNQLGAWRAATPRPTPSSVATAHSTPRTLQVLPRYHCSLRPDIRARPRPCHGEWQPSAHRDKCDRRHASSVLGR